MLEEAVGLGAKDMIALVGAGGKTTLAFSLAAELSRKGHSLLVTTTTKIYYPRERFVRVYTEDKGEFTRSFIKRVLKEGVPVLGKGLLPQGKVKGLEPNRVDDIFSWGPIEYIIVEADGAARKPIKLPAEHEPVIPKKSTIVLGFIGMDAIGRPMTEANFHRVDIACRKLGYYHGQTIDEDMAVSIVLWSEGLFKGVPEGAKKVLVLNKADGVREKTSARKIAARVLGKKGKDDIIPDKIIVSSLVTGGRVEVLV
ncbi:MAG: selenium cofactor biosynthesis protein YqeC [Bacillota bacterium]|jgi:probable selenium-dependent hydroxylase accessory protein YqeC|nr:selenium cofactor biosynthesis protein YqeC [Bacillota bacterium]MDD3297899.1 selenium cofactor biosynthesis protein YqeC [Bacillota bacterium]MDD3851914.1 selenium cofactor biosynthesis protein YqeC [Bacillota bacterium]MDD4707702.1 selenium cofactor biosynthesis protein YqeC [Bacillota bacterium]